MDIKQAVLKHVKENRIVELPEGLVNYAENKDRLLCVVEGGDDMENELIKPPTRIIGLAAFGFSLGYGNLLKFRQMVGIIHFV